MSRKLPSLNSLRAFESVARNQSFRRAADELCVTHSAISHQVKLLEDDLGVLLFHRVGRSIALTKDGLYLYPVVRDSFDSVGEAVSHIKASHASKTLTIQTYVTFGTTWLMPRLNEFQSKYPDIRVRISISFVDVDFDKDDADIGIIMGEQVWSHWSYEYLFDMDIFPVCSPKLLEKHKLETPADLIRHNLINIELAAEDWRLWLVAAGQDPELCSQGAVVDNYLQALGRVYKGDGLVMARKSFAHQDLEDGRLVRPFALSIDEPGSWFMVYPKERSIKKEIILFKEWLLEQVRQDPHVKIR